MSSLERLRVRSEKRPLYSLEDSDDDDFIAGKGSWKGQPAQEAGEPPEKFVRDDAKEDACQSCGTSGTLVSCSTCTYTFHKKCLYPCARAAIISDTWSCPECVTPLTEIEKILDCETRPVLTEENDPSKLSPKRTKCYLVKWKRLSYLHCTWVPEKEFIKASKSYHRLKSRLNNFRKQMEANQNVEDDCVAIRPEWTTVDRILASRKFSEEREYLVKWRELPYDECTWEVDSDISAFKPQIERYNMIQSRGSVKSSTKSKNTKREVKESILKQEFQQYDHTPEFLTGGKLHPYQLEGLNFLRYSWSKSTHVILADEMGLGKTIQSIAFLASLFEEKLSPHLVVAPLSTLRNWEREFATWAPQLNVVMYFGSSQARDVIKKHEFYFPKQKGIKKKSKKTSQNDKLSKKPRIKFDVLLTSYEMINMDSSVLKPIEWECMIVDEGHRLKNKDSKLFNQLKLYSTKHRVLLTGTPLQNNLDELFMLMHFLDAGKFASIEEFQKEFKDINQEEQIARLHKMLAPHLLRRVKKDVMKDLPPKKELILRVELSNIQKEYYKAILTRNYQILARRGGPQISLINVVMELRKLCCHAYMLEGVEPATELTRADEGLRQFLDASGKMQLLDKMMVKLKNDGHRVLIYSQFQHMLDLLEDYLSYKKWTYERIDGKVSGAERQIRIDRFNAKNSTRFCFLLSTRAGGLGINLATADTVIIYDSDWNPHADLQAMARAHRLGQTNKVLIYRLITRGTIEERMMQMTKKKMILEHLVVGRLKSQTVNQEELDDIIRYGSKELFSDESDEAKARQIHYDDAAIDRLLIRDYTDGEEASVDEEDDDFLKAFKVANFEFIDEAEADAVEEDELRKQSTVDKASTSNADRANYWDELLKDKYEVQKVEEFNSMGKGKRSRKQIAAVGDENLEVSSEDEDYLFEDHLSENEAGITGNISNRTSLSKKRTRESHPLMEGEGRLLKVLGFNQNQRALFQQLIMRFGFQDFSWKEYLPRLKGKSLQEIHNYGKLFMEHLQEDITDSTNFSDGVPKEARMDDVMVRIANIQLIEEKVECMSQNPGLNILPEDVARQFPSLSGGRVWKREQDMLLLKAILKHGYARWQSIVEDNEAGIAEIARRELNLPNGQFSESAQINDNSSSDLQNNGISEAGNGREMQQGNNSNQSRELQKKLVEFIRKRYFLLEKALNLEYAKSITGQYVQTSQDAQTNASVPVTNNSSNLNELLKQLPELQQISPGELVFDNKNERLETTRLYNEMCRVIEENACDSAYVYLGDNSAASRLRTNMHQLEIIHKDVDRILHVRDDNVSGVANGRHQREAEETVKVSQECPPNGSVDAQNGNQGWPSISIGTSEQGPEPANGVGLPEQQKGCEDSIDECKRES